MNKLVKTLILTIVPISLLSSCNTNIKKQYFVEGSFLGDLSVDSSFFSKNEATLIVKNITEEEYNSSNYIDVVKDINGGKTPYFSVQFKIHNSLTDEFESFPLKNLEITNDEVCIYKDENDVLLQPYMMKDFEPKYFYSVSFNKENKLYNYSFHLE